MSSSNPPDDDYQAIIHSAIHSPFRPAVASGIESSGGTLRSIGSGGPWEGASKQLAAASRHLDKLIRNAQDADKKHANGLGSFPTVSECQNLTS